MNEVNKYVYRIGLNLVQFLKEKIKSGLLTEKEVCSKLGINKWKDFEYDIKNNRRSIRLEHLCTAQIFFNYNFTQIISLPDKINAH